MPSRLLVFALVVSIVACSHQETTVTSRKPAQQENAAAAAVAAAQRTRQTEISRREWRRSHLRLALRNDELESDIARKNNEIAELEGRPQITGPEKSADARILSDHLAISMDDDLDEMEHNMGLSPALTPQDLEGLAKFRIEIDALHDQWDEKIRAAKTGPEAFRLSQQMGKAEGAKLAEYRGELAAEIKRLGGQVPQETR